MSQAKKVLVTGSGQLSWELQQTVPANVELIVMGRTELDISNAQNVEAQLQSIKPDVVINAAAYTAVDKAESEQERAFAVNAEGPKNLARECQKLGAYFLHVSTDFVFDGTASRPYVPSAEIAPLGVYGESKAEGEKAVAEEKPEDWAIIRTAWVYSSFGNNFVKTMLRLMGDKPALGVVGDQVGTPTWARGLAIASWEAVATKLQGIHHWTDAGVASWYDFAEAIQRLGVEKGLLSKSIPINAIATEDYPTPAARPSYSVLSKSSIYEALPSLTKTHWQEQLSSMLDELVNNA